MSGAAPLVLVARIVAAAEVEAAEVEAALRSLFAPTRREVGCELYALHRDLDDPGAFVMLERWRTAAHWLAHIATRHVAEFRTATVGRPAAFHVTRLVETE